MNHLESPQATPVSEPGREIQWEDMEKELQFGWIGHAASLDLERGGSSEERIGEQAMNDAMIVMIETYGAWLRTAVLTGERREDILALYAEDPAKAYAEIDRLWAETAKH